MYSDYFPEKNLIRLSLYGTWCVYCVVGNKFLKCVCALLRYVHTWRLVFRLSLRYSEIDLKQVHVRYSSFSPSVRFLQRFTFIFNSVLLLLVGKVSEAWETLRKQYCFRNPRALDRKGFLIFLPFQSRATANAVCHRAGFDPTLVYVRFLVNKLAVRQVLPKYFCFYCQIYFTIIRNSPSS
jgi:hypothetical protein